VILATPSVTDVLTWTIGAGGLIGSAIQATAEQVFAASPIPWANGKLAGQVLIEMLGRFRAEAKGSDWAIVWAAGAATVASESEQTKAESEVLRGFTEHLSRTPPSGTGVFFLSSSAGGVFAGAQHPPFDDLSEPRPLSPYGWSKLENEIIVSTVLHDTCPVVIGRFSNVYGPGQKLTKLQGLISRLALAAATRQPINVFVPLSTVRDYIFVDDAAASAHWWIRDSLESQASGPRMRTIASGQGASVGQLIRTMQDVSHRKIPIAMGSHPSSPLQAPDLRFVPSRATGIKGARRTALPVGMKQVFDGILHHLQRGQ
jgi:UDP-glucose 4-epimerase